MREVTKKLELAEITEKYVYLEVLRGKNERVQIPVSSGEWLSRVETGEQFWATLKSVNEDDTAWEVTEVLKE